MATKKFHAPTSSVLTNAQYHALIGDDGIGGFKNDEDWANLPTVIEPSYDSTIDTLLHIKRVGQLLTEGASELIRRANCHDDSKLRSPEKDVFDEFTPKLKGSTYGTPEYFEMFKGLKPALDNHYASNSHHPEYYPNGVNGMDLFDLFEMFLDWKAASERHENGDIINSIEVGRKRFELSDQLCAIFYNHAERYFKKPQICYSDRVTTCDCNGLCRNK